MLYPGSVVPLEMFFGVFQCDLGPPKHILELKNCINQCFFSPNLIGHYNQRVAFNPRSSCTTGCSKSLLKGLFSWLPSLKLSIHQENHVLHLVWSCLNINYLKTILKVSLNSFTQKISGLWSERQAAYSPSPVFEEKNDHSPQPNTHKKVKFEDLKECSLVFVHILQV